MLSFVCVELFVCLCHWFAIAIGSPVWDQYAMSGPHLSLPCQIAGAIQLQRSPLGSHCSIRRCLLSFGSSALSTLFAVLARSSGFSQRLLQLFPPSSSLLHFLNLSSAYYIIWGLLMAFPPITCKNMCLDHNTYKQFLISGRNMVLIDFKNSEGSSYPARTGEV